MPSSSDRQGDADRTRATVVGAFVDGWRRLLAAPALTAGALLATILTALPLAVTVRSAVAGQLGSSLTAERLLGGWDLEWAGEFGQQAHGVAVTLTHEILGFGGTLATISAAFDGLLTNPVIAIAGAIYVGLWLFLSGGMLDRLARGRPIRTAAFFAACGTYFVRFLRLSVLTGVGYAAIFMWLHPFLFKTLWDRWTRDLTYEPSAWLLRLGLYAVFATALLLVSVVSDFAKVRAVVEDRRSMISALVASLRFVRRRPWRVLGLYLLNILAVVLLGTIWWAADPPVGWPPWLAFAVAQAYIAARIVAKLAFMASEIAFFQGELAHAHYTAASEPTWPESPAAEAIN
jgi:hypothetical protein